MSGLDRSTGASTASTRRTRRSGRFLASTRRPRRTSWRDWRTTTEPSGISRTGSWCSGEMFLLRDRSPTSRRVTNPRWRASMPSVLDGLDRLEAKLLRSALRDSHPQLRRHALRLAESGGDQERDLLLEASRLADDRTLRFASRPPVHWAGRIAPRPGGRWRGWRCGTRLTCISAPTATPPFRYGLRRRACSAGNPIILRLAYWFDAHDSCSQVANSSAPMLPAARARVCRTASSSEASSC